MKSISSAQKKFQIIFIILGICFFLTRLINLEVLPISNDEAVYIYWAKIIATTNKQWFITLTAGKPPLVHWLMVMSLKLLPNQLYLAAGRLPAVLGGAVCILGIYKFSNLLFSSRRTSIIAVFLAIISPFILFYDRLALFDSFLSALLVWTSFFAFKTGKTLKLRDAVLWGISLGLAFLAKPNAILFIAISPAIFLISVFEKDLKAKWKNIAVLIFAALIISQLIHNSLAVSQGYHDYLLRSLDYKPSGPVSINVYLNLFVRNVHSSFNWLTSYHTLPFFGFGLFSFLIVLYKKTREGMVLFLLFFVPIGIFSLFGKIYFPRYILSTTPYFIISAAFLLNLIFKQSPKKFLACLFFVIFLQIQFDFLLLFIPTKTPLPKIDKWQYITGYPSSYGFDPIYSSIDHQLKSPGKVTLLVQGGLSHFPDAFRLRYWNEKRISIFEQQDISKIDPFYFSAMADSKVFIVFRDNGENYQFKKHVSSLPVNVVVEGKKPEGKDSIYLTELK